MKHITEFWNVNKGKYTITNLSVEDEYNGSHGWNPSACFEADNIYYLCEESNDIDLTQKEIKFITNNYPQVIWPMESNGQSIQLFIGPFEFTNEELEELSLEDKDIVNNILKKIENCTMCSNSFAINKLKELAELTQDGNTINIEVIDIDGTGHNMLCYNGYFIFTTCIEFDIIKELPDEESIIEDFINDVNDSESFFSDMYYDNIQEFIKAPYTGDYKQDTVSIITRKEKLPIIQITKTETDELLFIVDITTENRQTFMRKAYMSTKEDFNTLLEETIEMLYGSAELSQYAEDLSEFVD